MADDDVTLQWWFYLAIFLPAMIVLGCIKTCIQACCCPETLERPAGRRGRRHLGAGTDATRVFLQDGTVYSPADLDAMIDEAVQRRLAAMPAIPVAMPADPAYVATDAVVAYQVLR